MLCASITDWLPVIAAGIVASGAVIGIPLAHRYQAKRERERWLADRRLDSYSALATANFSLGHMTLTRGDIVAGFAPNPAWLSMYQHVQTLWERYQDEAAAAQHRALLVSDQELYSRVVAMNEVTRQMVDASLRAGPEVDNHGTVLKPPDSAAREELDKLAEQLIELRNRFLQDAWRAIHGAG